eukprot:1413005-Rhodomonas_salina.1
MMWMLPYPLVVNALCENATLMFDTANENVNHVPKDNRELASQTTSRTHAIDTPQLNVSRSTVQAAVHATQPTQSASTPTLHTESHEDTKDEVKTDLVVVFSTRVARWGRLWRVLCARNSTAT